MNIINTQRAERLVEMVYGNENGAPMDEVFKADLVKCFILCGQVYAEFEDKSIEFNLAVMSERIGHQQGHEFFAAHDIAVHYYMALSKETNIQADKVADELKSKLKLMDPDAKVTRMAHRDYTHYYHLFFYDPNCKTSLNIAFMLDQCNLNTEDWHQSFLDEMNGVINGLRTKIMTTRHPDCEAKGCQYAAEHGAEGSCAGRCYWVNLV